MNLRRLIIMNLRRLIIILIFLIINLFFYVSHFLLWIHIFSFSCTFVIGLPFWVCQKINKNIWLPACREKNSRNAFGMCECITNCKQNKDNAHDSHHTEKERERVNTGRKLHSRSKRLLSSTLKLLYVIYRLCRSVK